MKLRRNKEFREIYIFQLPDGWRLAEKVADGFFLTLHRITEPMYESKSKRLLFDVFEDCDFDIRL